jgi:hypothetical protein
MNKIVERIATGLRRCKYEPDFFISHSAGRSHVCGIPVYIVKDNVIFNVCGDSGLDYIPVWKNEEKNCQHDFERGFEQ